MKKLTLEKENYVEEFRRTSNQATRGSMSSTASNFTPETNKYNRSIAGPSSNDNKSSMPKASTPIPNNISSSEATTDCQSDIISQNSSNSHYLNQLSTKDSLSTASSKLLFEKFINLVTKSENTKLATTKQSTKMPLESIREQSSNSSGSESLEYSEGEILDMF